MMVTPSTASEAGAGLSRVSVSYAYLHSCDRFFHMDRNKLCYHCEYLCVHAHTSVRGHI